MIAYESRPLENVVRQHAEETAILRHNRSVLLKAPHVKLYQLARLDERIAAHLDGLAVAGEFGSLLCDAALERPGIGDVFAAAVRAIEERDHRRLDRLFALVDAVPDAEPGLMSAFGWVSAQYLEGTCADLMASPNPLKRRIGIAACAMHGADGGTVLRKATDDEDAALRGRALRSAGDLGRRDLRDACAQGMQDDDVAVRFWAARSALLLGDRDSAVNALQNFTLLTNAFRDLALRLLLKVVALPNAHSLLKSIAADAANKRLVIQGAGISGDAQYL